jgi:hypothetical protein
VFAIALTDSVHSLKMQKVPSRVSEYLQKVREFCSNSHLPIIIEYELKGFEVLTAVIMKSSVFWNIMLCSLLTFSGLHGVISQKILYIYIYIYISVCVCVCARLCGLVQWYSTFFVCVPPHIISLQLCTPEVGV